MAQLPKTNTEIEEPNQLYNVHLRQFASGEWINLQLSLFDITLISRIVIFIKEFMITLHFVISYFSLFFLFNSHRILKLGNTLDD